jgi:hypothetical protein
VPDRDGSSIQEILRPVEADLLAGAACALAMRASGWGLELRKVMVRRSSSSARGIGIPSEEAPSSDMRSSGSQSLNRFIAPSSLAVSLPSEGARVALVTRCSDSLSAASCRMKPGLGARSGRLVCKNWMVLTAVHRYLSIKYIAAQKLARDTPSVEWMRTLSPWASVSSMNE